MKLKRHRGQPFNLDWGSEAVPPSSMTESFDRLHHLTIISAATSDRMKKAVGFRNVSIHEYQSIDWLIVYKIITDHLGDFKDFARQVHAWPG